MQIIEMRFNDLKDTCFSRNLLAKTKREMQVALRTALLQDLATRMLDQKEVRAQEQLVGVTTSAILSALALLSVFPSDQKTRW